MPKLGDILNSINLTKDADLIDEYNKSDYVPFLINRGLSFYPETILHANFLNSQHHLDRILQYKYYLSAIKKKKRFSKWHKKEADTMDLTLVKEYFGYSSEKANEALSILSEEQLNMIKEKLYKGGK